MLIIVDIETIGSENESVHAEIAAGSGKIICIGYATKDSPACTFIGDESEMINRFYDELNVLNRNRSMITVVGHNVVAFDLKYLRKRSIINRIKPSPYLPFLAKSSDKHIQDIMLLWDDDQQNKISLDKLCRYLGIASPKSEMNGSKVWQAYKDGRIEEIADYCRRNIEDTYECYVRMTGYGE